MKTELLNGWTIGSVMNKIKKYNNGNKAVDSDRACTYMAPDGNRCAIGCLLSEDVAMKAANFIGPSTAASALMVHWPELRLPFNANNADQFQGVHDNCHAEEWLHVKLEDYLTRNYYDSTQPENKDT